MAERQGYADYQRTSNWDGEQVLSLSGTTHANPFTTERFNASRFAYLAGFLAVGLTACRVDIQWFSEQAGGETIGQRQFVLNPGITDFGQVHIPHLGPWFQLTFTGKGAELYEPRARLFNSNRVSTLDFAPRKAVIMSASHVFAGAGSFVFVPLSYFAGPARVHLNNTIAAGCPCFLEVETEPGVFVRTDLVNANGAGDWLANVIIPSGSWRFTAEASAGLTLTIVVTPSLTGSS